MKKIILFLAVFFSFQVYAVEWKKDSDFLWNAATGKIDVFPGAGSGQVWDAGQVKPSAFGPTLQRQKSLPFNPSPKADFKATFKPSAIAKGLMNPTGALITLAGAAILQQVLDEACVGIFGGGMEIAPGGQWQQCNFRQEVDVSYTAGSNSWPASGRGQGTTHGAACSDVAAKHSGATVASGYQQTTTENYSYVSSSDTSCKLKFERTVCTNGNCVTSTVNPAVEVGMLKGTVTSEVRDGWKPISAAEAEVKVAGKLEDWTQADFLYGYSPDNKASQVVDKIMQSGNGVEPDIKVTGPASSPTTTTTTVNSNNTTTTVGSTNNYQYTTNSPVSSTVTVTTVTTTNVTNTTTGAVEETTTTTEEGKETEDPCIKNPERVGCAKLGDVPETQEIPNLDVPVTFTSVVFSSSVGCPPPISFNIHILAFFKTLTITYAPMCDLMLTLRPIFLAIGAAAAAWLFMEGLKV